MTEDQKKAFVDEYKTLCEKHGLFLSSSRYDWIVVYEIEKHRLAYDVEIKDLTE